MHKLSVLIHTYNNRKIINRCLESIEWADEIIICDSFSSDDTVKICKRYTKNIYYYGHKYSADQKNWTISKCSYEWIFHIDSDEVATPELGSEIRRILAQDVIPHEAFRMSRKNHVFGKWVKGSDLYPDMQIRLFKNKFRYEDKFIHAKLRVKGKIGELRGHILHYGFEDWETVKWKFNRYRALEHLQLKKEKKRIRFYHILIDPIVIFMYLFFIKKGLLDSWRGFFWPLFISALKFCLYKDIFPMRSAYAKNTTY